MIMVFIMICELDATMSMIVNLASQFVDSIEFTSLPSQNELTRFHDRFAMTRAYSDKLASLVSLMENVAIRSPMCFLLRISLSLVVV
jgi:hypothetical protein